jgi:hypothetical protein
VGTPGTVRSDPATWARRRWNELPSSGEREAEARALPEVGERAEARAQQEAEAGVRSWPESEVRALDRGWSQRQRARTRSRPETGAKEGGGRGRDRDGSRRRGQNQGWRRSTWIQSEGARFGAEFNLGAGEKG